MTAPPPTIVEFIDHGPGSHHHVSHEVRVNGVPVTVDDAEVITEYGAPTRVVLNVLPARVFHRKGTDDTYAPSERLEDRVKRLEAALNAAKFDAHSWEDRYHLEREAHAASRSRYRALEERVRDAIEEDHEHR